MNWYTFHAVERDFINTAKTLYILETFVPHSRGKVWQAIVDAENWHQWFPGVIKAHYGDSPKPYGVGTRRYAKVGKACYEETMLVWDEEKEFAYRIDRATVPIAHAQLESTRLQDEGSGTRLIWVYACDRKWLLILMAPFFRRYLQKLWNRTAENLTSYLAQQSD